MNVYAHLLLALTLVAPATLANELDIVPNYVLATRIIYGTEPLIIDVRTPEEFAAGHVPGAINMPHDQIAGRYQELNVAETGEIVVYCRSGKRAAVAEQILLDMGFTNVATLEGHWLGWSGPALVPENGRSD
jgi:rhodanese-related sulfurtransferase